MYLCIDDRRIIGNGIINTIGMVTLEMFVRESLLNKE